MGENRTQRWTWQVRGLNSGELVAGVADEHAGLPHGPIPNRDALDELGHRARRRRRAHFLSLAAVPDYTTPRKPGLTASSPPSGGRTPSLALCSNACVNAASFLYCDTWESERVVANLLFVPCSPIPLIFLFFPV